MKELGQKSRKPCVEMLQEERRHAVTKMRAAVRGKIMVGNGKRCNIIAVRKRLLTVKQGLELRSQNVLNSTFCKREI